MKKLSIILLIVICSIVGYSQTTINTIDTNATYCEILGSSVLFSKKLTISIDYGQDKGGFWNPKDARLKDEDGKLVKFNSMIDVLNIMSKEGWEFVTAYVVTVGNQNVYHWLLRKR